MEHGLTMDIKLEKNESLSIGTGEMNVEEWQDRRLANQERENAVLERLQAYHRETKRLNRLEAIEKKAEARSRRLFSENQVKPKWEIS